MAIEATPAEGRITTGRDAEVFLIGIDRPDKLNGFSLAMYRQLADAFTAMEHDDAARAPGFFHGRRDCGDCLHAPAVLPVDF